MEVKAVWDQFRCNTSFLAKPVSEWVLISLIVYYKLIKAESILWK